MSLILFYECRREVDTSPDDVKPVIARPANPLPNSMLYRLSGIDGDDVDENGEPLPMGSETEDYFEGEWPSQFSLSEFQPSQFFSNWNDFDKPTETKNGNRSDGAVAN